MVVISQHHQLIDSGRLWGGSASATGRVTPKKREVDRDDALLSRLGRFAERADRLSASPRTARDWFELLAVGGISRITRSDLAAEARLRRARGSARSGRCGAKEGAHGRNMVSHVVTSESGASRAMRLLTTAGLAIALLA